MTYIVEVDPKIHIFKTNVIQFKTPHIFSYMIEVKLPINGTDIGIGVISCASITVFLCAFWSISSEKGDGNSKVCKNVLNLAKKRDFTVT